MKTLDRVQSFTTQEFKVAADGPAGSLSGTACEFGVDVPRGWGMFIRLEAGCFAAAVKDPARVKILWQHDRDQPIGKVSSLSERSGRLMFEGRISEKVTKGAEALELLRDDIIDELSVGFEMVTWTVEEGKAEDGSMTFTYKVSRAKLNEISTVTFGAMGRKARVTEVHSADPGGDLLRLRVQSIRAELARLRA